MKTSILIIFLLASAGPVHALDRWTWTDTTLQLSLTALYVADWGQTRDTVKTGCEEENPILGHNPSIGRINTYFVSLIVGQTVIAVLLPSKLRTIWQGIFIGYEGGAVLRNARLGARISF